MMFKLKLKIKFLFYHLLGFLTVGIILCIAYLFDKLFETLTVMLLFYIYRSMFTKQWHSKSLYLCSFISIIVFSLLIQLELKFSASIIFSIILTFMMTFISYNIRDYLDNKIIIKNYENRLINIPNKCIENLSEDEMVKLLPDVREDIIHIVYGYLHREGVTSIGYAMGCGISEATLFRYVKQVKSKYESLGQ